MNYAPDDFFDLTDAPRASALFKPLTYVWEGVGALPGFIEDILEDRILGEVEEGAWLEPGRVFLGEGSKVERGTIIRGPAIIGSNTTIRSGAYLRGHVLIGDGCVIGWGVEMRQTLVLNGSRVPHFNGVYTSLIGNAVNMAGKASTANYRLNGQEVTVQVPMDGRPVRFSTGQTLFGAVIGDESSIGGDSLLQPGTLIGRRCIVYPQSTVSGYIPHDSIVKRLETPMTVLPRE
ncbi:MAG: UDP-N-acetylglucosamine diphosphorylase [Proteobacteria bacterium]|nr:UDP-N-acetylglucosamine diphosphorylase [Pseudomonadota bacterium]